MWDSADDSELGVHDNQSVTKRVSFKVLIRVNPEYSMAVFFSLPFSNFWFVLSVAHVL